MIFTKTALLATLVLSTFNAQAAAFHFAATSLFTRLGFSADDTVDTLGGFVGNVSIIQAVPEPESCALLLAGLGLMGIIARRRKSRDCAV